MTLWDVAAGLYARPGVEAACLRLQDLDGQSVSLLLWRLWSVQESREVGAELLEQAVRIARTWEESAVFPLREARRRLKAPLPPIADAVRTVLRDQVAAAELAAERILFDALDALTPPPGGALAEVLPALRAVCARWAPTPCEENLQRLVMAVQGPLAETRRSATNRGAQACG